MPTSGSVDAVRPADVHRQSTPALSTLSGRPRLRSHLDPRPGIRHGRRDVAQRSHLLVAGCLGDDCTAVGMAGRHDRAGLLVDDLWLPRRRLPPAARDCARHGRRFSARLVTVLRCCTLPGEQVALPCDELLDGFRGSAGDFLDRGSHAVIPILAMQPGHGEEMLVDVRSQPGGCEHLPRPAPSPPVPAPPPASTGR